MNHTYTTATAFSLLIAATITMALATKFVEPAGGLLKPKWYSKYKPNLFLLSILALFTGALTAGAMMIQGGPLSWVASSMEEMPQETHLGLAMLMFGITSGAVAAAILQDLKTKTVPSLSIVLLGIPAVTLIQYLSKGNAWLPDLIWTVIEMLFISGIIFLWEYRMWKKGGEATSFEIPQDFEVFRRHGKWFASVGREDEIPWLELCYSLRAGIIVTTPEGDEIHGMKNRLVVFKKNGEKETHILESSKEDFSWPASKVRLPKQAMGRGDLHLACLLGLTVGPGSALFTIGIGGLVTSLTAIIRKADLKSEFPMIPGMAVAYIFAIIAAPQLREMTQILQYLLPQ